MSAPPHEGPDPSEVAFKAAARIFEAWGLSGEDVAALLDVSHEHLLHLQLGNAVAGLTGEQLLRISALIGIYKALSEFFSPPLAKGWITTPNTGPLFEGARPVDLMIAGGLQGFLQVRAYVEGWRW